MTSYTIQADPIRVEVERFEADHDEPAKLEAVVFRGDSTETVTAYCYRGESVEWDAFASSALSPNERHHVEGALLAEWAQWPEDGEEKTAVELIAELKRLLEEFDAPEVREGEE